ncbi:tetratricopeptide repeat protein [Mucisphaera calidilacus]|uniref:Tetratricopeptide repeat protein n=1 Tax=Mucisphaera calidilacus TaxID=2527982 RepID=A0A518BWD6_9BACT|nr:hypothetical protein [Mucisphaera calidilacus]QDU71271.1 hypothetical protein Pan265_11200 [Mucisphaera calidilacus]
MPQRPMFTHRWTAIIIASVILALIPVVARAQVVETSAQSQDQQFKQILADRIVLYALQYLKGDGEVAPYQYAMTEVLFDEALSLAPDDLATWHLYADLATGMGDAQKRERALRQIIRLDPEDETAKLDLIFLLLDRIQTLDERLQRVQTLISNGARRGLSDALRSRLAVYAAAAARELDDTRQFRDWLKLAVKLDPANDSALRMVLDYAIERDVSDITRADVTMQLIAAAPIDRGARLELGHLMLQHGCYNQAAQQILHGTRLGLERVPTEVSGTLVVCYLGAGQLDAANQYLELMRTRDFAGEPDEEGRPTPGPLPLQFQVLQLLTLLHAEEPLRSEAFNEVAEQLAASDEPRAPRALGRLVALFNPPAYDLIALADRLDSTDPKVAELLRARHDLNNQQIQSAMDRLLLIAPDEPAARLLQAQLPGVSSKRVRQLLSRAVADKAEDLAALAAGIEHHHQFGESVAPTEDGQRMIDMMRRYPGQLWKLIDNFRAWTDVDLYIAQNGRFEFLDPMNALLEVANISSTPITLGGSGGAISDITLINTVPSYLGRPFAYIKPIIVSIDRKLTLEPGARVSVPINLSHYMVAGISADNPFTTLSIDFSAILDPRPTPWGAVGAGPLGSTVNVRGVVIRAIPPTPERLDEWIGQLGNVETTEQLVAAVRVMGVATHGLRLRLDENTIGRAAGEFIQAYLRASPEAQSYLMLVMSPETDINHTLKPVLEDAATSEDDMVRMAYLLRHANTLNDPALAGAIESDQPSLRQFAVAYQEYLRLIQTLMEQAGQQQQGDAPRSGYIGLPTAEEILRAPDEDDPFATPDESDNQ